MVNGQNHFITAPRPEPSYGLKHEAPKGGKCELLHSALPMHAEEVEEWEGAGIWLAVLAAGRKKVGIKEEKEKVRSVMGGVM